MSMEGTVLIHHGIKGQRWGIRRFQNEDGTLTEAGKKRYFTGAASVLKDAIDSMTYHPNKKPIGTIAENPGGHGEYHPNESNPNRKARETEEAIKSGKYVTAAVLGAIGGTLLGVKVANK